MLISLVKEAQLSGSVAAETAVLLVKKTQQKS
jgi:hypothetical protein